MDLGLKGKSVLITGGSKGIGFSCAQSFAAEGCASLQLAARNEDALHSAAAALRKQFKVEVGIHALDLSTATDRQTLLTRCAGVDILINNAGDVPGGSIETIDAEQWRQAWELKVFGYIEMTRSMLAHMRQRRQGVVVNVIGMSALNPSYDYICGCTANAALHAFTRGVGRASMNQGVRVVGVLPPATITERLDRLMKARALSLYGDETRTDQLIKDGIWPPPIAPAQVADMIVYLSSARASQLSGVVFGLGA